MKLIVPPPIVALCAGILIWALSSIMPWLNVDFPGRRYLALVFVVAGIVLDGVSVVSFLRAKTTVNPLKPDKASKLVISGFYHITRNPMYLGFLFLLTGWTLWLGNVAGFLPVAVFVWFITMFQIMPEENVLRRKFGEDYEVYCQRVRRWI